MPKDSTTLDKFLDLAKSTGVPRDSVERFLKAGYIPQPKQLEFHAAARAADSEANAADIGFGGARGGAKTHAVFAQAALDDCQRISNLKVLFLRKVAKAAKESINDLRKKVLTAIPHKFNQTTSTITFENGSFIVVGNFKNESDIDKYLGLEYDLIIIEEATQLTLSKVRDIQTVLRTSKPSFRPRMYYTTNPGGVGHAWFKKDFIVPFRNGLAEETKFIPSSVKDNKFVDKGYIKRLERLTGWKRKAWLNGDWDVLAGQFFTSFSRNNHVIEPFEIPSHWQIWASHDYGFNHPTVCMLFAKSDGVIYVVAEHSARQRLVPFHSKRVKEMLVRVGYKKTRLHKFVSGQDSFAQRGNEDGKTIADQYEVKGISLSPANTDRISGAGQILSLLGDDDDEVQIEPRIKIFSTCVGLIEQLPLMEHDPNRPEDVLKVDVDEDGNGGDDFYDCLRYGVMVDETIYKKREPQGVHVEQTYW